jgi:hypothetical protein
MSQFDWTPYLVGGATRPDAMTGLDPAFATSLAAMFQSAPPEIRQNLRITSAYRSPEVQARLWEQALAKYGSPEAARKWVAPPGHSQHNRGTAVDFGNAQGGLLRDANSPEARWLAENAGNFGLAVPMSWEPWQIEPAGARGGAAPASSQPLSFGESVPQISLADMFGAEMPMSMGVPAGPEVGRDRGRLVEDQQRARADQTRRLALADLIR